MALVLSLRRGIILHHDQQRSTGGAWTTLDSPNTFPLRGSLMQRCKGRVVGIVGLGRIGTAFALRAKAFDFEVCMSFSISADEEVVFYDPFLPNGVDKALGIERIRDIRDLFRRADVISLHCHHTPATRHLVNSHTLSLVKPDAVVVNTARGELVDLDALYVALKENRLLAAGLDVVEVEPPVEPLPILLQVYKAREKWLEGRFVVTPHAAYFSRESVVDMRLYSAETMRDVLFDGLQTNMIDITAW